MTLSLRRGPFHPDLQVVTPDLKAPGVSRLLHVDLGAGRRRLGGSALAQVYGQLGSESPDVKPADLKAAFNTTQRLLAEGKLLAGHDVSDGGLVTGRRHGLGRRPVASIMTAALSCWT